MSKSTSIDPSTIPYGHCRCGCGGKTTIPTYTNRAHGIIKGVPRQYISGHNRPTPPLDADRPNRDARRCICGGWRNRNGEKCRECWNKDGKPPEDPETYIIRGKPRRRIPLTQEQYAFVDAHNYKRMMRFHYYAQWSPLKQAFYAKRSVSIGHGQSVPVPMQYDVAAAPNGEILDHIDPKDTLNNCEDNLRPADRSENMQNRRKPTSNTSGRKNVRRLGKGWAVRLRAFGVDYNYGPFPTFDDACAMQEEAVKRIHGEFGNVGD